MDFYEVVDQVAQRLQQRDRLTYRSLKRQFDLDDDALEDLKEELLYAYPVVDDEGRGLVWTGDAAQETAPNTGQPEQPTADQEHAPSSYTPQHLAEKILTARSALEGERKQVTVMFADIKDSTELIRDLDPEAAQQLLDPAIHIMMDAVHRYEGTVNQVLGDGIMAIFGAPVAHEDHAVRACYAALSMQTEMKPYADEMFRSHGITMRIRVGLNSGEVVVRTIGNDLHMDYSAVGQTTNLASRMEQLAAPGSVVLTAATLRLVEGLVRVNDLGSVPVKGISEPVEVYELTGASTIKRRLQAAVARGLTKFVGRDTEMEALNQARERAEAGHGQVVAAVGEAGVGKSRLAYEFIHSHRTQGWLVLESASVSYGKATPYFPVVDLLKRYVRVEEGDDLRTIRAKATGQILTLDETLQETIPPLLSLLDALPEESPFLKLDPPQRRQRTLDGLKRILLRESQVQPLLLVFEDLHWIDSETQALLDSLVESLPTAQILLLVNYRPEYQHGWGSKTYYTQLRLDPLASQSAEAFLGALLGDDPSLEPLKKLLIERTQGNPFFLEESVRTLMETEVLAGESGGYRLAQDLPTIEVPATVQAILAARIDRLPQDEKQLLQTAAVIGTEVPFTLLQAIAEMPEEALYRSLTHLQAAEFLYETNLFPERVYTFKHALTQNVAYQSLLTSTRQHHHQHIAQTLEARFPEIIETQPELLAQHCTEAGMSEQAVNYWHRAGDNAIQRSAYTEATNHLSKGLELLTTLPSTPEHIQQELILQTKLAPALRVIKGPASPEVERTYARARVLCHQIEHTPQLFPILRGLSMFYLTRGELQAGRELAEQCLSLAQRANDPLLLRQGYGELGRALLWFGEFSQALTYLEQALALSGPQQNRESRVLGHTDVRWHAFAARTLWYLGYPEQALVKIHQGLALAQHLSDPPILIFCQFQTALLHWLCRDSHATYEQAESAVTYAMEHEARYFAAGDMCLRGWALTEQGNREEGMTQLLQGISQWRETEATVGLPEWLTMLAEGSERIGQIDNGLVVIDEALALVEKTGRRNHEAEIYRFKSELLLARSPDNQAEAETYFHKALNVARHQQAKSLELRAAMSLARLWQSQGKHQEAYDLLAPVYGWFTEGFDTADLQEAKALLDELA